MTTQQQLRYWGVGLILLILVLYLLSAVLLPFVAGMAVAYLLDPVTDRLEKRVSRTIATAIVLVLFFLACILIAILIAPVLGSQFIKLAQTLPKYVEDLRGMAMPYVEQMLSQAGEGLAQDLAKALAGISFDAIKIVGQLLERVWSGGIALANLLSLIVITPIVAFYLLRDWDHMMDRLDSWLPRQHAKTLRELAREIDSVMSGFLRGQGTVCLILGIFYAVALSLVGLDFGLVIGVVSGLVSFIPLVGAVLGMALSILPAISQFWPEWLPILLVVIVFAAGQFLEGNFLTPRLLGDRIGLHPVWVMFALLAGGALFGFLGILLAVPAAAAIGVLVRFFLKQYLDSRLFHGPSQDPKT